MPAAYRGDVKVQGRTLRGWLVRLAAPTERVPFDLVIDGEVRGTYLADRIHTSLERQSAFGDGMHGFSLQLDRGWVAGGLQTVSLKAGGQPTGVELHAELGPARGAYFEDDGVPPPRRSLGKQEAAALRELSELRRQRKDIADDAERADLDRRYFAGLDAASRAETAETGWSRTLLLSRELYQAGRYAETIAVADRLVAAVPDHFRALLTKGRSLIALNRAHDAHDAFARASALEPDSLVAQFNVRIAEALMRETPLADGGPQAAMLVAVGGGIGDLLHATPMIRNIARRMGARVDVVIAEEYPENLFLMHHPEYVNRVYSLSQGVLARHYKTVFVSHFFGELRVPFNGERVVWSRARDKLMPGSAHETLFNMESARDLLGVPFDDADATHYYVGDFVYRPPAGKLIGFHAGSKSGHWTVKRWPHFAALAARLNAKGLSVASFGVAEEYVEGTENRTGGTIREMCEAMLQCSFFVTNDSGVMNIANAMGIPLLAVFAPTDAATLLPLRPTSAAIALEKVCAPCHRKNHALFAAGACSCIGEIGVEDVERRLDALLAGEGGERIQFVR